MIQTFNLTQVVDVLTRVTENTSTLIDHFYVTNPELVKREILIQTFNLTQVVDVLTRVTENTSTLIDHFYVTNPELVKQVAVPPIGLSDHYPISMLYERYDSKMIKTQNTKYKEL